MKILLLEDNLSLNRAIKKVTELDNHTTVSYMDGQDVLDNIDDRYDLYILDINVPNINGLELLDIIYTRNNKAKVIIISSNIDMFSIHKAYKLGCMDYLKKPFHVEELRLKIDKLNLPASDPLSTVKLKEGSSLTKKEKEFLHILLENINSTVTYEMIEESVYKGSAMSMDSLRALVRRVRLKLVEDTIQNVLEEGYLMSDRLKKL